MRSTRTTYRLAAGVTAALAAAAFFTPAPAADHQDGPFFAAVNSPVNGTKDINDLYLFQAPGNPNNTVMILTVNPFAGNLTPVTFDPNVTFDFRIDNTGDNVEDLIFRVTVSPPDANGVQDFVLRGLPAAKFPAAPGGVLARGKTGQNVPITGGGMVNAGLHDDPFFFDGSQFTRFIQQGQGSPVRNPGVNRFGPNGNTMAITVEVPSAVLRSAPNNPNIKAYICTLVNGAIIDRTALPAINTVLLPPAPRNNLTFGARQAAFNLGLPRNDRRDFRAGVIGVLTQTYRNNAQTAAAIADFVLPDIMPFDTSIAFNTDPAGPGGFPNGRRLRDDVVDVEYGLILSAFGITSDNVPDDNGDRLTDGTRRPDGTTRTAAFPYIGPPNPQNAGPNP